MPNRHPDEQVAAPLLTFSMMKRPILYIIFCLQLSSFPFLSSDLPMHTVQDLSRSFLDIPSQLFVLASGPKGSEKCLSARNVGVEKYGFGQSEGGVNT